MNGEDKADILKRIKIRLKGDSVTDDVLQEYIQTLEDRICLRINSDEAPKSFYSIIVDASVKMYRRLWYEGESSESDDGITTSFVEDILNEYSSEFAQYLKNKEASAKVVKFI